MEVIVEKKPETITIPEYLVYEILDGQVIPYRGFKKVLSKEKTLEGIMGSSGLQSVIVTDLLRFIFRHFPEEEYEVLSNEAGLHLSKKNNLATDIGIYKIEALPPGSITDKYMNVAPLVAIEVDTRADLSGFAEPQDYFNKKTNLLLEFGVERVIWITTASRKVMVAAAGQDWIISDLHKPITLVPGVVCNLAELLAKRGLKKA
jgi:Uma2 family endonuclease